MNAILEQVNSMGNAFVDFALPMLIQSSVLIVVLLGLDLILRKRVKAVFRYWIWMIVLLKLVLPTTLSSPTSPAYWFGDELHDVVARQPTAPALITEMPPEISPPAEAAPSTLSMESTRPDPGPSVPVEAVVATPPAVLAVPIAWQGLAFLLWLVVVITMALLLIQRMFFVKGLIAQSTDASEEIAAILEQGRKQMKVSRHVTLRLSPLTASPSVCGLFRPTILIPQSLAEKLDSKHLRSIIVHELAHIKRGDLWVSLFQTALQIIYVYNPLLWLANAMIRKIREAAVDETVLVAMGEQAEDYPRTLLDVSRLTFGSPALSLRLIGVVESRKALAGRIRHIASRPFPETARLGIAGLLGVIVIAAVLLPMAKAQKDDAVGTVRIDHEKIRSARGVKSLPSLILTDSNHVVREEGFSLSELDEKDFSSGGETSKSVENRQGLELTGRVLTEDGQPVPGAIVCLGNTYVTDSAERYRNRESLSWQGGLFRPAYLQSESDGRFVFNFLPTGTTDVWAEHPRWGWAWMRNIKTDAKDIELRLRRQPQAISLSGKVLDADREPSKDARILVYTGTGDSFVAQTESGAEGQFEINVEPPWTHFRQLTLLCIPKSGPPAWRIMPYCSVTNLRIHLKQETEITGRVVNSKGEGISNATVRFARVKDRDYGIAWFFDDMAEIAPSARTDATGDFTIKQVPLGSSVSLRAEHPDYGSERDSDIVANRQGTRIGDIQLPDGITIEGTVRFAGTNEVARDIKVRAVRISKTLSDATTDRNGRYRLDSIAVRSLYEMLNIRAEGSGDTPQWEGQATIEQELTAGDHLTDVDIYLERPLAFRQKSWRSGRGKVVEGCQIVLLNDSDPAYRGKEGYEDTVTLYGSGGKQQWQVTGLNTCQTVGASHALVYNPHDETIWCAESVGDRLIKLELDGTVVLEKKDMKAHALAVDPETGNVWILTAEGTIYGKNLIVLNSSGQKIHVWDHNGFDIAYSEKDDCFWVVGKTVLKINKNGEAVFEWPEEFAWVGVSVSINNRDGSAWVIERRHSQVKDSQNRVWIFEPNGKVRRKIDLKDRGVSSVAVDSQHGFAWVTTSQGVLKLALDGEIEADIPIRGFSLCIEPDTGYVWISGQDGILHRLGLNGNLVWSTQTPGDSQKWLCAIPR